MRPEIVSDCDIDSYVEKFFAEKNLQHYSELNFLSCKNKYYRVLSSIEKTSIIAP
jgi:hypothetical protein